MSIPKIDVNRQLQCSCPVCGTKPGETHYFNPRCVSLAPEPSILVPLELTRWRSVTMTVRLGECSCPARAVSGADVPHRDYCLASLIRVTCSIGGKTWEESEVFDVEATEPGLMTLPVGVPPVLRACNVRWEIIKKLLCGPNDIDTLLKLPVEQVRQRDKMFNAIAKLARAEDALSDAANECMRLMGWESRVSSRDDDENSPAAKLLVAYVDGLVQSLVNN